MNEAEFSHGRCNQCKNSKPDTKEFLYCELKKENVYWYQYCKDLKLIPQENIEKNCWFINEKAPIGDFCINRMKFHENHMCNKECEWLIDTPPTKG